MQNGIVPVVLAIDTVQTLWYQIKAAPGVEMTVSLIDQTVTAPDGVRHRFEIDATRRERLMKGLDDVGVTLEHLAQIEAFEHRHRRGKPWLPRIA
jgi:3-isopropylmalate/(R)-2-methylmalate dehydratase small subunit